MPVRRIVTIACLFAVVLVLGVLGYWALDASEDKPDCGRNLACPELHERQDP